MGHVPGGTAGDADGPHRVAGARLFAGVTWRKPQGDSQTLLQPPTGGSQSQASYQNDTQRFIGFWLQEQF